MRRSRIFLVSLVLASCSCASVCALPSFGRERTLSSPVLAEAPAEPVQATPIVQQEQPAVLEPAQASSSTPEPVTMPAQLSEVLTDLERASRMNKKELSELISNLEKVEADIKLMQADAEEKATRIEELENANGKQADDLAYLQGKYDRETSTKSFASVSGLMRFEDEKPILGCGGTLGIRFGTGLMASMGMQYFLGTFDQVKSFDLDLTNLDRLQYVVSVGWEW